MRLEGNTKIILGAQEIENLGVIEGDSIDIDPRSGLVLFRKSKGLYSIPLRKLNEIELYFESPVFHKLLSDFKGDCETLKLSKTQHNNTVGFSSYELVAA